MLRSRPLKQAAIIMSAVLERREWYMSVREFDSTTIIAKGADNGVEVVIGGGGHPYNDSF